jgi:methylglyoxal/glyoxal reductase
MDITTTVKLNNGIDMPLFGLGVLRLKEGGEVENAVKTALQHGYRMIDTASVYHNEKGVAKGIKASGIPREEIFITTKVANDQQGYHNTIKAFQRSLNWLQTTYIDMYLIHWPIGKLSVETWQAMEELYKKGLIRAIGVSNFWIHHLEDFLPQVEILPALNQVEFHPWLSHPDLKKYCDARNIRLEAWSPVMQGKVFKIPEIIRLAEKYNKTPAQIVLRWDIQKGVITIPRTGVPGQILSNADIFNFELNDKDVNLIDNLNRNQPLTPYYDKLPYLMRLLIKQRKASLAVMLSKATLFKIKNRFLKSTSNGKKTKITGLTTRLAG